MNNTVQTRLQHLINSPNLIDVTHEDLSNALKEIKRLQRIVLLRRKYLECDCYE